MEFDNDYFQDFFTLNDLDVQKKLIHLSPFPSGQLISHNSLFEGQDSLTKFVIKKGENWADLLFTGWPGLYVVSESFKNAFDLIKGIKFIPVKIIDKKLQIIDVNYYRMQVLGKSGGLVKDLSKKETATRVPGGTEYVKFVGLFFDPNFWDGSDVFTPENTLYIFITSKIKSLIEEHRLTNIRIERITEIETFFI